MKNNSESQIFLIRDLDTLRVIADPIRAQVFEILAMKPQTVNDVAEKLGLSASKLYYHVSLLEKHNLIEVAETRLVGNLVEKLYRTVARELEIDRTLLTFNAAERNDGLDDLVRSILDTTREDILRSLQARYHSLALGAQPLPRDMTLNRIQAVLSEERAREFKQKLHDLLEEFSQSDLKEDNKSEDTQLYTLAFFLYPSFYYSPTQDEQPS